MAAIHFVVTSLLWLYQVVLLLRLLMQWVRADFRNPLARAIVQLTDPLILPLRKILPPIRRIDTASVVAILAVTAVKVLVGQLLLFSGFSTPELLLRELLIETLDLVLVTYLFVIFLNAILSFVAPENYSPAQSLLNSICEPVLRPIRRHIPSVAGLDLSPLWALIAIQALRILIHTYGS
jgi:YggT family protein